MTWKLNVGGIHDLEPTQTKDCVLDVSKSKTKNILSPSAKLMLLNAKPYTPKNVSKHSTFRNLGNQEQFIFLMSCKDRQILIDWLIIFILVISDNVQ